MPEEEVDNERRLLQRLQDDELVKIETSKVGDYVKWGMFEKLIFIFDKRDLELNSKLHQDYLQNCQSLLAGGELGNTSEQFSNVYMNMLWNMMLKDKCYQRWLGNRRSNTYQAMQYGCMSKKLPLPHMTCVVIGTTI